MKVLLCVREDYLRNFAGDSMQIIKTEEYLKRKGIQVDINNGDIVDYSQYDLIHLFNIASTGEIYKYYRLAHSCKKNIVISPMYWNLTKFYDFNKDTESMKLWKRCNIYRKEILKGCKKIFVNSIIEKEALARDFNISVPFEIIYNGVNVENEDIPLYNFKDRYNLNNYVLSVGRINAQKNQLTLAKACNELGIQLVLIGNVDDREYFEKCISNKNVIHLGFMDNYNIYNAYRFARTHVLPGFVEMPGLSSLEAAAIGCNIVSSTEGCAAEYFKEKALYCNPYDYVNMLNAVETSFKRRKSDKLKKYVIENFSWENCINKLLKEYEKIIN